MKQFHALPLRKRFLLSEEGCLVLYLPPRTVSSESSD